MRIESAAAMAAVACALAFFVDACARSEGAEPLSSYVAADRALRSAMADPSSWPSYGRDSTNQRFSPLAQITSSNVGQLALVWHFHTGIPESFETSPLVVGRTMYVTTPLNHVIALDAGTGVKKWEYVHPLGTTVHCCGPNNRGAAFYGNHVYMATLDAHLVALDTATGHVAWETIVEANERGYSITPAPIVADGKVIVGVSGAEYGIRGSVSAYDAATGRMVWRFWTIPSPEEGGWWGKWAANDPFGTPLNRDIALEKKDSAKYADAWRTGGGSMWQAPAIDTARKLVIFGVDNASPDIDGVVRPGDNLYTNSIVALDLATGKIRWYMQEVPHDTWDYDATSPVVLVDLRDASGNIVPAAAQAGKTGWVYVVDRRTGAPIRRSEPFVEQKNMFERPTRQGVLIMPGGNGGSEWSPTAYSPETGYLYILGLNEHNIFKLRPEKLRPPASWLSGVWYSVSPTTDYGSFTAIDLQSGRVVWQDTVEDPMVGGALATAGGLVFVGTKQRQFRAYDARAGRVLWKYDASAGVNAPPISYAVDGRQYIAVAAGGNFQINAPRGDELLVFALGGAPAQPGTAAISPSPGSNAAGTTGKR